MKTLIKIILVFLFCVNINSAADTSNSSGFLVGDPQDVARKTSYGIMMMGGGEEVSEAFKWFINKAGKGDVIVIATEQRQIGSYERYLLGFGANSVESILIDTKEKANSDEINQKLLSAEGIFLPGGSQHDYVLCWKETKIIKTLEHLIYQKKIPISGTSAGMAIMGEFYFAPKDTLCADPLISLASAMEDIGKNFININIFKNVITDTHYDNRKRQGRHIAFMAFLRNNFDLPCIKGIGIDEATALCVEETGIATIYGVGEVYFHISDDSPECCEPNKPIHWDKNQKAIKTYIGSKGHEFDLKNWKGRGGKWKYFYVLEGKLGCIDLST
jgi:cyanophycinase